MKYILVPVRCRCYSQYRKNSLNAFHYTWEYKDISSYDEEICKCTFNNNKDCNIYDENKISNECPCCQIEKCSVCEILLHMKKIT